MSEEEGGVGETETEKGVGGGGWGICTFPDEDLYHVHDKPLLYEKACLK